MRVLFEHQPLASKQVILWHDLLNNIISSHLRNSAELLAYLVKARTNQCLAYCRRTGTPDIFENLRKAGNLISRSNRQNLGVLRQYLQLWCTDLSHLSLLRSEISQENADRAKASGNQANAREVVRRCLDEKWWPSVIFYLNLQARCNVKNLISYHKEKS